MEIQIIDIVYLFVRMVNLEILTQETVLISALKKIKYLQQLNIIMVILLLVNIFVWLFAHKLQDCLVKMIQIFAWMNVQEVVGVIKLEKEHVWQNVL